MYYNIHIYALSHFVVVVVVYDKILGTRIAIRVRHACILLVL